MLLVSLTNYIALSWEKDYTCVCVCERVYNFLSTIYNKVLLSCFPKFLQQIVFLLTSPFCEHNAIIATFFSKNLQMQHHTFFGVVFL